MERDRHALAVNARSELLAGFETAHARHLDIQDDEAAVAPDSSVTRDKVAAVRFEIAGVESLEFDLASDRHYLAIHDIEASDGEISIDGLPPSRDRDLRHRMTFIPAGLAVKGWTSPIDRNNAFTALYVADGCIPDDLRASGDRWSEPLIHFRDRALAVTLGRLDLALKRDDPFGGLLSESIAMIAFMELSQRLGAAPVGKDQGERLSSERVARVREFIHANLSRSITLADLAATVDLSKFHFARAYKNATGRSAYREVLETRVGEARRLLAGGVQISEAARLTGFNGLPQFSRAMKQVSGLSPTAHRPSNV
jgi:AraC family transcriptional regulator